MSSPSPNLIAYPPAADHRTRLFLWPLPSMTLCDSLFGAESIFWCSSNYPKFAVNY